MIIKCGNRGQNMEVGGQFLDGALVRCPSCRRRRTGNASVLLLLAIGIVGAALWMWHRAEMRHRAELARQAERIRLNAQRAEQERRERARLEAEEKARQEKRLAEEKERERQKKREAEEKERQEKLLAERVQKENALLAGKAQYKDAIALFRNGTFAFANAMPKERSPGKCEAEFFCIRPLLENGEIIVFKSTGQGIASACRLNENGIRTPIDAKGLLASLEGKDCLIAADDRVYFQSKRKKPNVGPLPKDSVTNLVREFFGDIAEDVRRLDLVPNNLSFEIVFTPQNAKEDITSETVEAGEPYSLEKVRDVVEEAFPMKAKKWIKHAKRFKRTVVLWDREQFKKGINGVMYVPRIAPPTTDPTYWQRPNQRNDRWHSDKAKKTNLQAEAKAERALKEWQAKYDEAVRQEQLEREHNERLVEERKAHADKNEREYAKQIDRILEEGSLFFRAKLETPEK